MKPRRILQVTRVASGGVAVVVDQLARHYDRKRYEPFVLFDTPQQSYIRKKLSESDIQTIDLTKPTDAQASAKPKTISNKNMGDRIETCFGQIGRQIYFSMKRAYEFVTKQAPKIKSYMNVIRQNRIDLVHTHSELTHGKPEILAAKITGVPCISHGHGYLELTNFDKNFARFVDSFVYISRDVAEYHIAQGKPKTKGVVIHNGTDMKDFKRTYDTMLIRRELCSTADEILVGMVGRIEWWKGHEYFLEAIAEVIKQLPNLKGVIIGDATEDPVGSNRQYFNNLQSIVKSLNIEDKILFAGFRSDVPRVMAALDVVVHASSIPEPFGLVVIEGMAAGKPVVATGAGGILDIIEDGVNGILVPCKDSKAMVKAIVQIVSDKVKAKQMGLAARQCVENKFTIQHQVTAIQKLYDSLLAPSQHG